MELAELVIEVVGVSASGVLAPGPLFFANLLYGARQGPKAGLKMAYGHSIVELPLVILLAASIFSSGAILNSHIDTIGVVGGAAILGFAAFQILSLKRMKGNQVPPKIAGRNPFLAGVLLSALNPFFLVWWFTAGLKMLVDSAPFGAIAGALLVFSFHIWMDYAWLIGTAYLSSRGGSMLKSKYYIILMLGLTAALVYFGLDFLISSLF
jgi:threonine/homoserine/homoserine lactone efflux protein